MRIHLICFQNAYYRSYSEQCNLPFEIFGKKIWPAVLNQNAIIWSFWNGSLFPQWINKKVRIMRYELVIVRLFLTKLYFSSQLWAYYILYLTIQIFFSELQEEKFCEIKMSILLNSCYLHLPHFWWGVLAVTLINTSHWLIAHLTCGLSYMNDGLWNQGILILNNVHRWIIH